MSLSVGLAVGFGVAGGIVGAAGTFIGNLGGGLINVFARGEVVKEESALKPTIVCAFIGAALGYGIGEGVEYITADRPDEPSAIVQQCYENAPDGKTVIISEDAIGNPICAYE